MLQQYSRGPPHPGHHPPAHPRDAAADAALNLYPQGKHTINYFTVYLVYLVFP